MGSTIQLTDHSIEQFNKRFPEVSLLCVDVFQTLKNIVSVQPPERVGGKWVLRNGPLEGRLRKLPKNRGFVLCTVIRTHK